MNSRREALAAVNTVIHPTRGSSRAWKNNGRVWNQFRRSPGSYEFLDYTSHRHLCEEVFGYSPRHMNKVASMAAAADEIDRAGETPGMSPINESQMRFLIKLGNQGLINTVWRECVVEASGRQPTITAIRIKVHGRLGLTPRQTREASLRTVQALLHDGIRANPRCRQEFRDASTVLDAALDRRHQA